MLAGRNALLPLVLVLVLALAACGKTDTAAQAPRDAGTGAPIRVPAPNSSLARELGADDAGRGVFRAYDDGPWCGFAPRVDREKPLGAGARSEATRAEPPASSWMGFYETTTVPRDGPTVYERAALALLLEGPKRVFLRQPLALALTLVNDMLQPLRYGMPVDGSFEHWRGPFVDLYAREESSGRIYRWTYGKSYGRCGTFDPRRDSDYVIVPPRKRKYNPFGLRFKADSEPVFQVPGRYTLWVVYASSCPGAEMVGGSRDEFVPPADLFEGTIASNGLTIDVVPEP